MQTYRLCGVVLGSDVPLAGASPTSSPPDIAVARSELRSVPRTQPAGEVLNSVTDADGSFIGGTSRADDGLVTVRVGGIVDFVIDAAGGRGGYLQDPTAPDALLQVFIPGLFLATYLQLTGRRVLHASASYLPALGGAVGFVGASGTGKSTIATVMAAGGYPLVADDLLRVERDHEEYRCFRGAIETRLRPKAAALADEFTDVRRTGDQRLAVHLPGADHEDLPLQAIVIPGPAVDADRVQLTRIKGARALFALLAFPRLLNWHDPQEPSAALDFHADLVERVPIFASRIPWGPPFPPGLAGQVFDEVQRHVR